MDERGNRTKSRRAKTGGRKAVWAWDGTADERRQHQGGGCGKEDRCPEAVGVRPKVHSTTKPRKVRLAAPMSRVPDKADGRVNGTWVGAHWSWSKREVQRQPQAAEMVWATMVAL